MRAPRFIALLAAAAVPLAAQQKTWPVAGVVVNSVTGDPVKGARMTLRPEDPPGTPLYASTDDAGRFSFSAVPQGKLALLGEHSGFPQQSLSQPAGSSGFGVAIITGPGLDMEHLIFRLIPGAAISGRVVDDQGDPVQSALIEVFRSAVSGGQRQVRIYRYGYSNDIGEFRVGDLGPGTYYLAVSGQPWYSSAGTGVALAKRTYPLTYYPGTSDASAASGLVLKPGQELTANLEVRTISGVTVSVALGEVTGTLHGALNTTGIEGREIYFRQSQAGGPAIVFTGVPPGEYRLIAGSDTKPGEVMMKEIEVGTSDLELQFEPTGMPRITGTVETDAYDASTLRGAYIRFYDKETGRGGTTALAPDGSFSTPARPGHYSVSLGGVKNLSMEGFTVDGSPAADGILDLNQPVPRELKIRATFSSARVQGHLYRNGRLLPGELVLLAPARDTGNPFDIHAYETDADGSFDFPAIRPGSYVLIAVEDGMDLEYANPAVLAPLRAHGMPIELARDETLHERLEVPASAPAK